MLLLPLLLVLLLLPFIYLKREAEKAAAAEAVGSRCVWPVHRDGSEGLRVLSGSYIVNCRKG